MHPIHLNVNINVLKVQPRAPDVLLMYTFTRAQLSVKHIYDPHWQQTL